MIHPAIASLTLDEKASLVSGASFWGTRGIDRVGIVGAVLTDGPHGVRLQTGGADHLGINRSEPATAFPTAAALGSTWDPDLPTAIGRALGAESRSLGVDVLLGPGVNIKRSPLCGRNFEYFAEDPLLSGVLGEGWVRGVQAQGVGASLKHFAANNQETDRMRISAEVDERTLREIYFPAFERIVKNAQPATVMCSYNRINGVYASQNRWLLTGFEGYVVSDWGAVVDPVAALEAGLDLEMPSSGNRGPAAITAAVRSGAIAETTLDTAASRVLSAHDRLRASRRATEAFGSDSDSHAEHHALARLAAAAGSVLLSNEGSILPLSPSEGGRIAVVGEFARSPRYQGAGSSHVNPTRLDDALSAIRASTTREIVFEPGFTFEDEDDAALRAAAVAAAASAESVVVFLGLPAADESEGFDRTHISLPETQHRLLEEIMEVNALVIVGLSNGSVVALERALARVPAVLEMWLGGQASGTAASDMIFGAVAPEGRLAETIPVRLSDTPAFVNWPGKDGAVLYGERLYVGYRWYDAVGRDVARPFGFGLTYTTFAYSDATVSISELGAAAATVEVTVSNTGDREGAEVVQVYVGDPAARVDRPVRELRAFEKVRLQPGESRRVRLELDERAFAYWDAAASEWAVDPSEFVIEVGSSSRDIRARMTLAVEVPERAVPLTSESTFDEWMEHPSGREAVSEFLAAAGESAGMLADPDMRKIIGGMPLRGIIGFAGVSEVGDVLGGLLARVGGESSVTVPLDSNTACSV